MTPLDIVEIDAIKNHAQVPPEIVLRAFELAQADPDVLILQNGDSLLILDGTGDFHFVNAARLRDFVHNVKELLAQAKEQGFINIHTNFTNPKIIEVAKQTGLDYTITGTPDNYIMNVRL